MYYEIYDDKKGRHQSVEARIRGASTLAHFDPIGYGWDEKEALEDLKTVLDKIRSSLIAELAELIIAPIVKIN